MGDVGYIVMNTMDKIITILLLTVFAFVISVLYFNWNDKQVQDSLIQLFLGMIAAELTTMGGIKMLKINHSKPKKTRKPKKQ